MYHIGTSRCRQQLDERIKACLGEPGLEVFDLLLKLLRLVGIIAGNVLCIGQPHKGIHLLLRCLHRESRLKICLHVDEAEISSHCHPNKS